ncbi:MAG: RNA helicase [bacterium]|nr:RNA helicase [bacterium]
MGKEIVRIQLDFLQGPIWISDVETGQPMTGIDIIDNDEKLRKINYEISTLYSSYYEFDSHEQACWFNEEQEKKDKSKMLSLLKQLHDRLNELNDGSFIVEDYETERLEKL